MTTQNIVYPSAETQQILVQGMMNVMALNIFATAVGLIVAATGLEVAPAMLKAGDPAVEALREAFGDEIVGKALTDVPEAEAIKLAERVEFYVHQDLRKRYGDWAADIAIRSAPPGDLRTARIIARDLSERSVGPESPIAVKAKVIATGRMKGRSKAKPQRDTKTGIVYSSEYAAGKAVAAEYGLNPLNTYVWYKIKQIDKTRFVPA